MSWRGSSWFAIVAAALTGVLFVASRDIGPAGPLALIGPIAVLVYALSARSLWSVAVVAFIGRAIGALGLVYAYAGTFPAAMLAVVIAGQSLGFTANVLLTRWVARRAPLGAALLAYPLFTTATEFLVALISPNGSFGALGYVLVDVLPLLQSASLGGVAALSFLAALIPMGLATLIHSPRDWRTVALVAGAPTALACVFGFVRLNEPYEGRTRVALAAIDALVLESVKSEAQAVRTAEAYAELVQKLSAEQPEIIVLPEKVFAVQPGSAAGAAPLARAAAQSDVLIVAGFDEKLSDDRRLNTARVFAPNRATQTYVKRKLVPGLEDAFTAGSAPFAFDGRGVAICKDMDFAAMIRDSSHGVQLMLAPAWDFRADGRLHARMALVRGVENGFALARAAAEGRLTVSDAYGRVVAERGTSTQQATTLVADIGIANIDTPYERIGELFGWIMVAGAACLLIVSFRARKPALKGVG